MAAWEDDSTPPGDVLMAAHRRGPGNRPGVPLLAAVPPAFPAGALAGPWVTAYQFSHGGQAALPRRHRPRHRRGGRARPGREPPARAPQQGRATPFRNEIEAGAVRPPPDRDSGGTRATPATTGRCSWPSCPARR